HLELKCTPSKEGILWQLVNQGTNGTFLNGVLISRGLLPDEALIQLAREGPLLKFQVQKSVNSIAAPMPPVAEPSIVPPSKPDFCSHEGNPPGNLFCIRCGQPLVPIQRIIRHYQVLR